MSLMSLFISLYIYVAPSLSIGHVTYMHPQLTLHSKSKIQALYAMRAPSNFLRSLLLRQPMAQAVVVPSPEGSQFGWEPTAVLDTTLWSQGSNTSGEIGLAQLLDAAITTQKIALDSLVKIPHTDESDRVAVDLYLENNVDVLDACNHFVDKIEHIKNYVDSLRTVARLVEVGSAKPNATTRAMDLLETCQSVEKRCKVMGKNRGSCLRKMLRQNMCYENEFGEVMCGSKAMALMCCRFLELGLSFDDSKLGLPSIKKSQHTSSLWLGLLQELANQAQGSAKMQKRRSGSALLMTELQQTVIAARELKEQMKGKREEKELMKPAVERLKISCRKLEDRLVIIEERVKDLYKSLIDVRMALLGILSQAHKF